MKKVPFNKWIRKYVFLKEGESYCSKCKGHGAFETVSPIERKPNYEHVELRACTKCRGAGKLDWVECLTSRSMSSASLSYRRHKKTAKVLDIIAYGRGVFPTVDKLLNNIKEK